MDTKFCTKSVGKEQQKILENSQTVGRNRSNFEHLKIKNKNPKSNRELICEE